MDVCEWSDDPSADGPSGVRSEAEVDHEFAGRSHVCRQRLGLVESIGEDGGYEVGGVVDDALDCQAGGRTIG